ncbi:MAG: glycogen synthase GlgA [Novosphingobium sp.]|nr:glycogen synthase GlgA [Novosphingobium sp.]
MTTSVLSVASEAVPLIKTGGLADVAGALPGALRPHGVEVTTLLPGYPSVMAAIGKSRTVHRYDDLLGEEATLVAFELGGNRFIALDAPAYFAREGGAYADANGHDWQDNWRRFAALGRAGADLASGGVKRQRFDVLHAHDWQAAMATAYLRFAPAKAKCVPPSVMTIHNMAFQGYFPSAIFSRLGLPDSAWAIHGVEYHGGVGFLKAGLESASAITTVSPSYAREIKTPEFGMGLDGLIVTHADRVTGILNGIDNQTWKPASDTQLEQTFTARTLPRRLANKRSLEAEFGLDEADGPLFVVISRLSWQKGMDVLLEVIDHLVGIGGRLAVLGSGDPAIENGLQDCEARHPGRVSIRIGYDEALSHRMQAGGDAILVPSRFEPCGLTQLYGLAYGCVPVVARTGGLSDTVIDANVAALAAGTGTGVQFNHVTYSELVAALDRTVALYAQPAIWRRLQRNGMACDFSWSISGKAYADLYASLIA